MSTARLKVIRETTDGFRIAEEDLKLRGEGDVLGVRQSGLPGYRIARTDVHGQLITQARDEALRIMKDNPRLDGARGEALRALGRKIKILVITEDWCPDSLRTIPAVARLVDGLPEVEMRVFLRDANPDVMDQYLKRGQFRAIPVFAVFDEEMNEVGRMIEAKMNVVGQLRTLLKV